MAQNDIVFLRKNPSIFSQKIMYFYKKEMVMIMLDHCVFSPLFSRSKFNRFPIEIFWPEGIQNWLPPSPVLSFPCLIFVGTTRKKIRPKNKKENPLKLVRFWNSKPTFLRNLWDISLIIMTRSRVILWSELGKIQIVSCQKEGFFRKKRKGEKIFFFWTYCSLKGPFFMFPFVSAVEKKEEWARNGANKRRKMRHYGPRIFVGFTPRKWRDMTRIKFLFFGEKVRNLFLLKLFFLYIMSEVWA